MDGGRPWLTMTGGRSSIMTGASWVLYIGPDGARGGEVRRPTEAWAAYAGVGAWALMAAPQDLHVGRDICMSPHFWHFTPTICNPSVSVGWGLWAPLPSRKSPRGFPR